MADPERMQIQDACKLIRQWNTLFLATAAPPNAAQDLLDAVATLKRYLERAKGDGKPIRELEVDEYLLATREGVQWVMPFVLSAEAMEGSKRRAAMR